MEVREKWKCEKNGSEKTKTRQQRVRKHPTQKPTKPPPHSRESGNLPIQRRRRESPAFGGHHREIPAFAGMGVWGSGGVGEMGSVRKKWKCEKNGSVKKTEAKNKNATTKSPQTPDTKTNKTPSPFPRKRESPYPAPKARIPRLWRASQGDSRFRGNGGVGGKGGEGTGMGIRDGNGDAFNFAALLSPSIPAKAGISFSRQREFSAKRNIAMVACRRMRLRRRNSGFRRNGRYFLSPAAGGERGEREAGAGG